MTRHYVYFISAETKAYNGSLPTKIGFAANPDGRLAELQTGNAQPLKIQATLPCGSRGEARSLEALLHYAANRIGKRMKGEWFVIPKHGFSLLVQAVAEYRLKGMIAGETEKQCIKRIVKKLEKKQSRAKPENTAQLASC